MRKRNDGFKVTWAEAVRDVLVTSISKGQFPLALGGLIFIAMIVRMPSEEVAKVAWATLESLKTGYLAGYFLAGFVVFCWAWHAKKIRRDAADELKRVTAERNKAQQKVVGTKLKSSGDK